MICYKTNTHGRIRFFIFQNLPPTIPVRQKNKLAHSASFNERIIGRKSNKLIKEQSVGNH